MIRAISPALEPSIALFQETRERVKTVVEDEDKENYDDMTCNDMLTLNNLSSKLKVAASSRETRKPRVLSDRDSNAGVFRFSSDLSQAPCSAPVPVPLISVQEDDDVFSTSGPPRSVGLHPSRLLLTPSTAHTPLLCSSLIPSPNIARGLCCSTPNRRKLEREGLTSTEKLVLGRGAFGTVVLGRWRGLKVAIKVMEREEGGRSDRRRNSLEGELHAKKLEHENIVKIFYVHAEDDSHAVIIMEYVGTRNLHRLLVELQDKKLGSSWLLQAALQVSLALGHCHSKGIIHLDVKPANVLVTRLGVCKLGDFGCSVSLSNLSLGVDHSLLGTPGYQAPEFLRGQTPAPACDVYSLAILLWQLDSREVPFSGRHPQVVMYQVVATRARPVQPHPDSASVNLQAFTSLYQSCWQHEPQARPSMEKVSRSLSGLVASKERLSNRTLRY